MAAITQQFPLTTITKNRSKIKRDNEVIDKILSFEKTDDRCISSSASFQQMQQTTGKTYCLHIHGGGFVQIVIIVRHDIKYFTVW